MDFLLRYKIEIERGGCIACGACYSIDPYHFEPDDEGKSTVIGGQTDSHGSMGIFEDEKMEDSQSAEDSCPISIIRVTQL